MKTKFKPALPETLIPVIVALWALLSVFLGLALVLIDGGPS